MPARAGRTTDARARCARRWQGLAFEKIKLHGEKIVDPGKTCHIKASSKLRVEEKADAKRFDVPSAWRAAGRYGRDT